LIRWANSWISKFQNDFDKLIISNERNIKLMSPLKQRTTYIQMLKSYSKMVKDFSDNLRDSNVRTIFQAKIYNIKLMSKYIYTIWLYEWKTFVFFKNKLEMEKHFSYEDTMERINELMNPEVNESIWKIQI
jgi:hypothetical protein